MPRKQESFLDAFILAPYWVSLITACIVYFGLTYWVPQLSIENKYLSLFANALAPLAKWFAAIFLVTALASFVRQSRSKSNYKKQKSTATLNDLTWKEFEDVCGEYFRRRGYTVDENLGPGPDGGVDLRLHKNGIKSFVQCKRWKSGKKVGLPTVRELLGAMTAEKADGGILITTSSYTNEATTFADTHGIQLIDGPTFAKDITTCLTKNSTNPTPTPSPTTHTQNAQILPAPTNSTNPSTSKPNPTCPNCNIQLTLRTAKKGPNTGKQFWGCPNFPKCRHTQPT